MTELPSPSSGEAASPWVGRAIWGTILVGIFGWAVGRMDLLPLTAAIPIDGAGALPRAYFSVDHPFHTARADLLRGTWSSLDTVRWVGSHQGGYPAEFYPFGAQSIAAALAIASFGWLAIESAWALTIAIVFLLPGVAYLLIGRVDRLTPAVATVALAGQVSIASDWTHGGYTELVEWGLATNVAGFTWALIALPLLAGAIDRSSPRLAAVAALAIGMCAVTNPRALLAVGVIGVALLVDAALRRQTRGALLVTAGVAALASGLAAPVLIPLVRYRDLYFFLSYQDYASIAAYWAETVSSVSWPVLALAVIGAAIAIARGGRAARGSAIALLLYMGMTAAFIVFAGLRDLIPQLELPRLMPFQRLLVLWLAAYGLVEGLRLLLRVPTRLLLTRDAALAIAVALVVAVVFTTDAGPFPPNQQGLREVLRTEGSDAEELWQFEQAVSRADGAAPDGTAILVIGSRLSWHEQLWAPMAAPERRIYANDWLWYWHRDHAGPYDYRQGHYYPDPSQALEADYLDAHGIGAVVITDIADRTTGADVRQAAATSQELERVDTVGMWDVYVVREPTGLATLDGASPDRLAVAEDGETIRVRFDDASAGTVKVRENWFPRWEATVNGASVPVVRGEDGYMEIAVPSGEVELELGYTVTTADIVARSWAAISAVVVVALLAGVRPSRRWARR